MSNVLLQTCRLQNMFLTKFIKLSNSKRKLKEAKDNNKGVSDPTFFNKKIKKRAIQDNNMVFRQIYRFYLTFQFIQFIFFGESN